MPSNKVPTGKTSSTSGVSSSARGVQSSSDFLEGKMDQLISEVNQMNVSLTDFKNRLQSLEDRFQLLEHHCKSPVNPVQNQHGRLKGNDSGWKDHDSRLVGQNTRNEEKNSQLPSSGETEKREDLLIKLVDSMYKREEPTVDEALDLLPEVKRLGMKNLVAKLSSVLMNALAIANCIVIFQMASQHQLEELRSASHYLICKNFNEAYSIFIFNK